jgi:hypothetical protein
VVDQLHLDDPNSGNNLSLSAPAVVPISAQADGKITSMSILSPPGFISANTNVQITVRTIIHSNGPFSPANFSLIPSVTPPPGCTVTPPAPSNHSLVMSTSLTVDDTWTLNCAPGSYTLNLSNSLTTTELHVSDPAAGNNAGIASLSVAVDTDGDGLADDIESACGSNPNNMNSLPERIDGVFAGADEDLDTAIDEALPASAGPYDCDRDGYTGADENHVYSPSTLGDQDPCGANLSPPTTPPTPIGWPADLIGTGGSGNVVSLLDITSFLAPIRYLDTDLGTDPSDYRWDLVPGSGILLFDINLSDLTNLIVVSPPMLGGVRALNGPACPYP